MKFTVNLEDFNLEEEDLTVSIQEHVKKEVIRQIWDSIKLKVEEHITRKVKDEVEKTMLLHINKTIQELCLTENLVMNGKVIPIAEYIKNQFVNNSGWNNPQDILKKLANQFGIEMKARYDLQFAAQIVAKMSEIGILKEDIAKTLLENNPK